MCLAALIVGVGSAVEAADVFNMPTGLTSLETVKVGNPGNAGEQSRNDAEHGWDETYYGGVADEYNIGKYEVTAGQYREFLNAVAKTDAYGLYNANMWSHASGCKIQRSGTPDDYTYSVAANWANRPVNFVSWGDAARFANWLHNGQPTGTLTGNPVQDADLTEDGAYNINGAMTKTALLAVDREDDWKWAITSEDEWYKAAYYDPATSSYFDYPTSSNNVPGRDMTEITNQGNNANYFGSPFPIDSPYIMTVAGEFELSESPYDTFDQGGNICEWTEAIGVGMYSSNRSFRGGAFNGSGSNLLASSRSFDSPTIENIDYGFRVVQVPEPAMLTILTLGGLALVRRRKRRMCK